MVWPPFLAVLRLPLAALFFFAGMSVCCVSSYDRNEKNAAIFRYELGDILMTTSCLLVGPFSKYPSVELKPPRKSPSPEPFCFVPPRWGTTTTTLFVALAARLPLAALLFFALDAGIIRRRRCVCVRREKIKYYILCLFRCDGE